tara:strand:- start:850 stop:1437 length:588 start_codon:yes stop_codon:yes gene_type:complete
MTISAVRRHFRDLVASDEKKKDGNSLFDQAASYLNPIDDPIELRVFDAKRLFNERVKRGQIRQRPKSRPASPFKGMTGSPLKPKAIRPTQVSTPEIPVNDHHAHDPTKTINDEYENPPANDRHETPKRTMNDANVDLTAKDGGYGEWRRFYWDPFINNTPPPRQKSKTSNSAFTHSYRGTGGRMSGISLPFQELF